MAILKRCSTPLAAVTGGNHAGSLHWEWAQVSGAPEAVVAVVIRASRAAEAVAEVVAATVVVAAAATDKPKGTGVSAAHQDYRRLS